MKGAVAKQAETTYAALPSEEHRKLARVLFLRLIDPGVTEQDTTRCRITRSELLLSDPKETVIMEEVTHAFTAARLLTTDTVAGVATVEVSHEAVIREWARLANWLIDAREDILRQHTISEDAEEWERYGKPRDRMYRGTQLKEAQAWARCNTPSADEVTFLRTSTARQARSRVSVAAMCLLIVLLVIPAAVLARQVFFPPNPTTVTTLADDGQGSLRQAIDAARSGGTVTFAANLRGAIRLKSNITIGKDLIIRGPGAANLSIMGESEFNVVFVEPWASVTISDLAFKGTNQINAGNGIIVNEGKLTLTNITVSGNKTYGGGGGITNHGTYTPNGGSGTLKLVNCIISGNESESGTGGGIANWGGSVTISNSRISHNSAHFGAGIFNSAGPLTLSNSTVSDNDASEGYGGGIYNVDAGTLMLDNSTVSNNTAANGWGGGINNGYVEVRGWGVSVPDPGEQGGPITLTDSTISGNTALDGGGILANAALQTRIVFSTLYGNTAIREGGGIAIKTFDPRKPSQVELRNTLVAGNRAPTGPNIAGTLISDGYNLIQNISGATFIPNKQHLIDVQVNASTDIRIDPALSGSLTQVLALLPGSPAIDQIPLDTCHIDGISTDQRGVKRPDGNEKTCDIGAFEYST